jgi:tRNA(Ile2) C34 agmatinyltransferase TiaS
MKWIRKKNDITIDTEPLKRFLNKQQNLKTAELIYELYAYQKKLEETRNISQSVVRKMRDQCILVLIDEIDVEFLNLKNNL